MTEGAGADEIGSWTTVDAPEFSQIPVHTAVLHTGKVLGFGGSGNSEFRLRGPHPFDVWDVARKSTKVSRQPLAGDIFCAGHTFLPDGRLLAAGGTRAYDWVLGGFTLKAFSGLDHTYIFDPAKDTWTRTSNLRKGRWYPTLVALGDGRVLGVAGLTKWFPWFFVRMIEVFEPGKGWRKARGASRWMPLYPHLHLLPDGSVFFTGTYNTHYPRPFKLKGFPASRLVERGVGRRRRFRWIPAGPGEHFQREEGASMLLPLRPPDYTPRILIVGGADMGSEDPMPNCEIVEIVDGRQRWRHTASMNHARYYAYPSLLPDGTVLVLGGRTGEKHHGGHGTPHLEPERYDPRTETWTPVAPMTLGREYHSSSLLLPDARVLALGGNIGDMRRREQLQSELYSPPYLRKGNRPEIESAPREITPGERFGIATAQAKDLTEVVLIRPTSTTHCTTPDQRFVELPIVERGQRKVSALLPVVPNGPYVAPSGHYMLFLLADGIPSVSSLVRVTSPG